MLKRLIALLLAACLCASMLPIAVLAEDEPESSPETTQVTETPKAEPAPTTPAPAPTEQPAPVLTEPTATEPAQTEAASATEPQAPAANTAAPAVTTVSGKLASRPNMLRVEDEPISLDSCTVTVELGFYTYTGSPHCPGVTVTLDGAPLTEGTDYTVSYSDNVNAGTATITVTGVGSYSGSRTADFAISKAPAPKLQWPESSAITYGQTRSESALIGGSTDLGAFAWENPGEMPDAGEAEGSVIFTPSSNNYDFDEADLSKTCALTVNPRPITVTAKSFICLEKEGRPDLTNAYTVTGDLVGSDGWVTPPTVSCDADMNTIGEYSVKVTADAGENYQVTCVDGVLSVRRQCSIVLNKGTVGTPDPPYPWAEGTKLNRPTDPTNGDFRFGGWCKDPECTTLWDFDNDVVTGDTTLFAKWEIPLAGIEVTPKENTLKVDDTLKLSCKFTPEDATIKTVTWASSDDSVVTVDKDGVVTAVGVGTATVKCTAADGGFTAECSVTVLTNKRTVTFDAKGGTPVPASAEVVIGKTVTAPKTPVKQGYTFLGWYTDTTWSKEWNFSKDTVSEDMTLYALWGYTFTMTYDCNTKQKVTNMPDSIILETNATEHTFVIAGKPHRSGYWFAGWNTSPNGKGTTYKVGSKFKATAKNPSLTLYAQWKRYDNPKTSDDSHIRFWTGLLIFSGVSLAAAGAYFLIKHKKK